MYVLAWNEINKFDQNISIDELKDNSLLTIQKKYIENLHLQFSVISFSPTIKCSLHNAAIYWFRV